MSEVVTPTIVPNMASLDENHRIRPGMSLNPMGKPKGAVGGRTKALKVLDDMLATEGNQALLRRALQEEFNNNPYKFFRKIIMPLLPQEQRLKVQAEGQVVWASLLTTFPIEPSEPSTTIEVTDSERSVADEGGERPDSARRSCLTLPESGADSTHG